MVRGLQSQRHGHVRPADLPGRRHHATGGSTPVTITTQVLVPPGAFKALAISSTPGFTPAYVYGSVRFDNDAAEQVNLICNGTLIDKFPYSDV